MTEFSHFKNSTEINRREKKRSVFIGFKIKLDQNTLID